MNDPFLPLAVMAVTILVVGVAAALYSGYRLRKAEDALAEAERHATPHPGS